MYAYATARRMKRKPKGMSTLPPRKDEKPKKPRPAGWNAEVATMRAVIREKKEIARRDARGRRSGRPSSMDGFPAWQNRHTGEPHEHARQKARMLAA